MPSDLYPLGPAPDYNHGDSITETDFEPWYAEIRTKHNNLDALVAKLMTMLGYDTVADIVAAGDEGQILSVEDGKAQWIDKLLAPNQTAKPDAAGVRYLWDTREQDDPIAVLDDTQAQDEDAIFSGSPAWQVGPPMVDYAAGGFASTAAFSSDGETNHSIMLVYDIALSGLAGFRQAFQTAINADDELSFLFKLGAAGKASISGTTGAASSDLGVVLPDGLHSLHLTLEDGGNVQLYLDGDPVGNAIAYAPTAPVTGAMTWWANNSGTDQPLGKQGVSGYWPRVLSPEEIIDNHNWLRSIYPTLPEYSPA